MQSFSVFSVTDIYRSRGVRSPRPVYETTAAGSLRCLACEAIIGRTVNAQHLHEHSQGHVENLMRYVAETCAK